MAINVRRNISRMALVLAVFLVFIPGPAWSQLYRFKQFNTDKGLCHNVVYALAQDKNGFLYAGTGVGLCRYDGFRFTSDITSDSLPQVPVKVIFKDSNENLWFGYDDGSIVYYNGKLFAVVKPNKVISGTINSIFEDQKGNIYFVNQGSGIIRINKAKVATVFDTPFSGQLLYSAAIGKNDELLIGTTEGLSLYQLKYDDSPFQLMGKISSIPQTRIECIVPSTDGGSWYVGTEDAGLFRLTGNSKEVKNYSAEPIAAKEGLEYADVQSVYIDWLGNLWVSTMGEGLFELVNAGKQAKPSFVRRFDETTVGSKFIKAVYQDREGIIWIATYGNGLSMLPGSAFSFDPMKDSKMGSDVTAVYTNNEYQWIGGNGGIQRITSKSNETKLFGASNGLPKDAITAFYLDESGVLWIGTSKSGIYKMPVDGNRADRSYYSQNSPENAINCIAGKGNDIYAATDNGIVVFDRVKGKKQVLNMTTGLPYNLVHDIYIDSKGNAWIASKGSGLFAFNTEKRLDLQNKVEIEFTCITEDKKGYLWAGTNGSGVFKFEGDSVYQYSVGNGLKNNFCYSIATSSSGLIWVGHRLALSRINPESNLITQFGVEIGISGDCNENAVTSSSGGLLLFGTTDGLIRYDASHELPGMIAPIINIMSVKIDDKDVDFRSGFTLPYKKGYKLRVDYIGVNFRAPERVTYQYKLKGFDADWMEMTTSQDAIYSNIRDGSYTFLVKACSGDGICAEQPMEFSFRVKAPFWKTWWFWTLSILIIASAIYSWVKYRERKLIADKQKLEEEVFRQTQEIRNQRDEIESQKNDITDSINYAQRIQASILPSIKKLQENFSGSFIFYRPRDIVSGDFYWYDLIKDNKFMLVCADSTGHGVPGAFMSMIGTTLIKDICLRPDVKSPGDILRSLDFEIQATLNQNIDSGRSNDGMDIIVCEIDIKKYTVKVASAMRPLVLYRNGEQIYMPGSKNSVGGVFDDKEQKIFEENEYHLGRGDLIYMFSDGYPDQFGGPIGKKYKMVRLRNMLDQIYTKPMDEQYQHVMNNFSLWKGDYEQVDDLLFIGIKL